MEKRENLRHFKSERMRQKTHIERERREKSSEKNKKNVEHSENAVVAC